MIATFKTDFLILFLVVCIISSQIIEAGSMENCSTCLAVRRKAALW